MTRRLVTGLLVATCLLWCSRTWLNQPSSASGMDAAVPVAEFSATPQAWNAPATVTFSDGSAGTITSWLWDFGDGTQSGLQNPVHQYAEPGSYTVSLTIHAGNGSDTKVKPAYLTVEEQVPVGDEYLIQVDPAAHRKFGLYYPATYKFRIPPDRHDLVAQYRYFEGSWKNLPEKTRSEIFNGVDAARFDYDAGLAYLSLRLDPSSDAIHVRIVDASGDPVPMDFDSIPRYYDDRRAAVTITLDDWNLAFDSYFRSATDYLGAYGLYYTVALIANEVPWGSVQQKIDLYGDHIEVASHSMHHACTATDYLGYGYDTEVIGSRDAIRQNLRFSAHPYVPVYVHPCSYSDATLQSWLTSGDYLLSRNSNNYLPSGSRFVAWNSDMGRYGMAAVAFDDSGNPDDVSLLNQANAAFDQVLAAGGIYHFMDHPSAGLWYQDSYLLQHLNHVKGRTDVWYVPLGQLYQYHFLQEMRGGLTIEHLGSAPLAAAFSAQPVLGVAPLPVTFSDDSTGTVTSWLWDFGDGQTASGAHATHLYTAPGTYTVTLTVTGPGGIKSQTSSDLVTVTPAPPVADFSAAPVEGAAPLSVEFTDSSTGQVNAWQWDFGDGGSASTQNPLHLYSAIGSYQVSLTVTGPGGSNSRTRSGLITVQASQPPAVKITSPASGANFSAGAPLPVAATATPGTGATVTQVDFFADATLLGSATSPPYAFTWSAPPAGSYALTARVTDSAGGSATSAPVRVDLTGGVLPQPWISQDVGNVGATGSTRYLSGTFWQTGAGSDIWGTSDAFRFTYQTVVGDGEVVARVTSLQNIEPWSKSGVMIRSTLAPNSAHALMAVTPGNGAVFQRRLSAGSGSLSTSASYLSAPLWVKVVRSGDTFTGYTSTDGATWSLAGSDTIAMPAVVYFGLATTSHNSAALCTSTLDKVSATGAPVTAPVVSIASPASGISFTAPATIPIAVNVSAGSVARIDFFASGTLLGSAMSAPYSFTWSGVPPGSYSLAAQVTDSLGATALSTPVPVMVNGNGLPAPWSTQDVGSVGVVGSATYDNGSFSLRGSGSDIWGVADAFRAAYQPLSGDGEIVARVTSQQNTNSWAKAAVMLRDTLTPDSVHVMMDVTPVNGAEFSRRLSKGGATSVTAKPGIVAPYWVKVKRSGSSFSGYVSANGSDWALVGSDTVSMGDSVYAALVVTSHNNALLCGASFDSASVTVAAPPVLAPTVAIVSPADAVSYAAPAAIDITATATPGTRASVTRIDFFAGSTLIGSASSAPYSVSWRDVPSGAYAVTATVTDSSGATATSAPVRVTVVDDALPAPWLSADIGSTPLAGNAGYSSGTYLVKGGGADIWGSADAFRFTYQPLAGDGEIVARVASLQNTNSWAKAGVMIRESLAATASHAIMAVTPGSGTAFQRRLTAGGYTTHSAGPAGAAPQWVKLVRSGNTFTGYLSADGAAWTRVASDTIAMPSLVYAGLAVTSHNEQALCAATLDGVNLAAGLKTSVHITAPASGEVYVAPAETAITATATAAAGATVSRVDFFAGEQLLGSSSTAPYSFTWSGIAAGDYLLTARVTDTLGAVAASTPMQIVVSDAPLPAPWSEQDVGSTGIAGSTVSLGSAFSVKGAGYDIWGTSDAFHFVYLPLTGDGEITARVSALQNTNQWAKGGVMIRQSLAANSAHAFMALTVANGAAFQRRPAAGALSLHTGGSYPSLPYFVRLVRSGDTFTGYVSANGTDWAVVGSDTVPMTGTVYLGLAVTSHNSTLLGGATFDAVTLGVP